MAQMLNRTNMEWKRIKNVVKNFKKKSKKICLSIDTRKPEIMIKSIKSAP